MVRAPQTQGQRSLELGRRRNRTLHVRWRHGARGGWWRHAYSHPVLRSRAGAVSTDASARAEAGCGRLFRVGEQSAVRIRFEASQIWIPSMLSRLSTVHVFVQDVFWSVTSTKKLLWRMSVISWSLTVVASPTTGKMTKKVDKKFLLIITYMYLYRNCIGLLVAENIENIINCSKILSGLLKCSVEALHRWMTCLYRDSLQSPTACACACKTSNLCPQKVPIHSFAFDILKIWCIVVVFVSWFSVVCGIDHSVAVRCSIEELPVASDVTLDDVRLNFPIQLQLKSYLLQV